MGRYQITCVSRASPVGTLESIYAVGGQEGGGWKLTLKGLIWNMRSERTECFVPIDGREESVEIVGTAAREFIKTVGSELVPIDPLLMLPVCDVLDDATRPV